MSTEQIIYLVLGLVWFIFSNYKKSKENQEKDFIPETAEIPKWTKEDKKQFYKTKDNQVKPNVVVSSGPSEKTKNDFKKSLKSEAQEKENEVIIEKFDLKQAIVYQTIMNRYED